jgi:hypothetical protein
MSGSKQPSQPTPRKERRAAERQQDRFDAKSVDDISKLIDAMPNSSSAAPSSSAAASPAASGSTTP